MFIQIILKCLGGLIKMKDIKLLLLSIFLLILSIYIKVFFIGYEMPNFFHIISMILPIVAVIVAVYSFFIKD